MGRKIVYIDSQNIHASIMELGWIIDWERFFEYITHKYVIDECKIFFGYISKYTKLYNKLEKIGYTVVFKDTLILPDGSIKGNVDIDIAIHVILDIFENELDTCFLVTGDRDYNSLVDILQERKKLGQVIIPSKEKSSKLLRKSAGAQVLTLEQMKYFIQKQKPQDES